MNNYQTLMEDRIESLPAETPLLLHTCCAPCATVALERLAGHFNVTLYYYNPNITSYAEWRQRLEAVEKLVDILNTQRYFAVPIALLVQQAPADSFFRAVKGLEDGGEGTARCDACFSLRLNASAQKAAQIGAAWFGTTLSTGPRKDAAKLYAAGTAAGAEYGVTFLPADFKKKNGYQRSIQLSALYGLYRQRYCGCAFSLRT